MSTLAEVNPTHLKISKMEFGSLCRMAGLCFFSISVCLIDLFVGFFVMVPPEDNHKMLIAIILICSLATTFSTATVLFLTLCGYRYGGVWQTIEENEKT